MARTFPVPTWDLSVCTLSSGEYVSVRTKRHQRATSLRRVAASHVRPDFIRDAAAHGEKSLFD